MRKTFTKIFISNEPYHLKTSICYFSKCRIVFEYLFSVCFFLSNQLILERLWLNSAMWQLKQNISHLEFIILFIFFLNHSKFYKNINILGLSCNSRKLQRFYINSWGIILFERQFVEFVTLKELFDEGAPLDFKTSSNVGPSDIG